MTSTPESAERSPAEYTPPITLGNGQFEIDTTPDGDGDLEVCNGEGDHIAYLGRADQIVLRDLLNKVHPPASGPVIHDVDWALDVLQRCGIKTADQFDALVTLQKLTP